MKNEPIIISERTEQCDGKYIRLVQYSYPIEIVKKALMDVMKVEKEFKYISSDKGEMCYIYDEGALLGKYYILIRLEPIKKYTNLHIEVYRKLLGVVSCYEQHHIIVYILNNLSYKLDCRGMDIKNGKEWEKTRQTRNTLAYQKSNQSLKKSITLSYSFGIDSVVEAIFAVPKETKCYTLISYDKVANIIHLQYKRRLLTYLQVQEVFVILTENGNNRGKTNVSIEVINGNENTLTNNEHKMRLKEVRTIIDRTFIKS